MTATAGGRVPDPALVVLVGASGSGKTTWAQARYRAQEVVSSDGLLEEPPENVTAALGDAAR